MSTKKRVKKFIAMVLAFTMIMATPAIMTAAENAYGKDEYESNTTLETMPQPNTTTPAAISPVADELLNPLGADGLINLNLVAGAWALAIDSASGVTYDSGIVTVLSGANVTFTGTTTDRRVIIENGATVTFADVGITHNSQPAIIINGSVNINYIGSIIGSIIFVTHGNDAAIRLNSGAHLTINGPGSPEGLVAIGGGIAGSGIGLMPGETGAAHLTVNTGVVIAEGSDSGNAPGINVPNLTVNGGSVSATGTGNQPGITATGANLVIAPGAAVNSYNTDLTSDINLTNFNFNQNITNANWSFQQATGNFHIDNSVVVTGWIDDLTHNIVFELAAGTLLIEWNAIVTGNVNGTPLVHLISSGNNWPEFLMTGGQIISSGNNSPAIDGSAIVSIDGALVKTTGANSNTIQVGGGVSVANGGRVIATGTGSNAINTSGNANTHLGGTVVASGGGQPIVSTSGFHAGNVSGGTVFGIGADIDAIGAGHPGAMISSPGLIAWLEELPTLPQVEGAPVVGLLSFPAGATGVWAIEGGFAGIRYTYPGGGRTGFIPIPDVLLGIVSIPMWSVTFDTHGGTLIDEQIVFDEEVATRPATNPTRSGYTFVNWFTAQTAGTVFDFNTPITANIIIHAQWEAVGSDNGNGGTGNAGTGNVGGGTGTGSSARRRTVRNNVGSGRRTARPAPTPTPPVTEEPEYEGPPTHTPPQADIPGPRLLAAPAPGVRVEWIIPTPQLTLPAHQIFTDVAEDDWYHDFVTSVVSHGLFAGMGDSIFSPEGSMTRAMFAQVLANLQNVDISAFAGGTRFTDVAPDTWYNAAVEWAAYMGIVSGVGDNRFDPSASITREQMAVMLVNFIRTFEVEPPMLDPREITPFTDQDSVSTWALDLVAFIQAAGIISGRPDGSFDPQAIATRAEVATIFARFLEMLSSQ